MHCVCWSHASEALDQYVVRSVILKILHIDRNYDTLSMFSCTLLYSQKSTSVLFIIMLVVWCLLTCFCFLILSIYFIFDLLSLLYTCSFVSSVRHTKVSIRYLVVVGSFYASASIICCKAVYPPVMSLQSHAPYILFIMHRRRPTHRLALAMTCDFAQKRNIMLNLLYEM